MIIVLVIETSTIKHHTGEEGWGEWEFMAKKQSWGQWMENQ